MEMMERLLLQVFERKKWIVDQVKQQTRLFDHHLASTLLIDGLDPPEWLIRCQPSAAEFKREEHITGLVEQPLRSEVPDSILCCSVDEKAPYLENNEKYPVDLGNEIENMIDTCNRRDKQYVLPEGIANGALDVGSGPHSAEFAVFSPCTQTKAETSGSHRDLELSLARLQRSKIRQQALELRNSAKSSRSPLCDVKSENPVGGKITTCEIACQIKFSSSYKKCPVDAQPVHVPGGCLRDERGKSSEGKKSATSGIVMQCVAVGTSSKYREDAPLVHAEETREVPVSSYEGKPICEMSRRQKIYVDGPEVHDLLRDSGEAIPHPRSVSGSDCLKESLGKAKSLHAEIQEAIEGHAGDSCNIEVSSINCSKKILRSQRSTCVGDMDDVISFEGSSNGKKGKNWHECMPQSTPLDHLQEADERCRMDRAASEVCQNARHESDSESLMESRRISYVSDNDKIMEMDVSSKIGTLLVEGHSSQVSKESKPLVRWGCKSVDSTSVTFSQHVSKRAANLQNEPGRGTDLKGYVEDSAGGFLLSMNLAEVSSLKKSEMVADDCSKDMKVLVSRIISPPNMILEHTQLKFGTLGEHIVGLDTDSTTISNGAIHGSCLLRQTSLKQWDDKTEAKSCEVSFEDHHDEAIELNTIPRQIIESSDPTNLVEHLSISDSAGGESLDSVIGGLSSYSFDEGKTTNLGEQEEPCAEEQRQADSLCSEEGREADTEPALQEKTALLHHIIGSSSSHFSDLAAEDQNDIVLEGFTMVTDKDQSCISENRHKQQAVVNAAVQNKRILELLSKSSCLNTPLQHHFMGNTENQVSRLYQSIPNGLLEHIDLRSSLAMNDGKQVDLAFDGRSYSDCLPYCEASSTRNNRKPYASPVGKLWESIHLNSGSSKQKPSLITELPSIIEEIELADETVDGLNADISAEMVSARRLPLAEISEDPNIHISGDDNEMARFSLDSTMAEAVFPATTIKLGENQESKKRNFARKVKGSKTSERGPSSVDRVVESCKKKHPKISLKNGGPSFSGKGSKLHNIVCNVTSFLPLVQQKQAPPPGAGKRIVQVKALEAAEAAKRQAEKKEIERKVKKEALKLERERIEKENIRQLELEKKRKDEERKKKEAEMALKKRLREEEEKKKKEKKRKRFQEPRKNRADRHEISIARKEQPEAKDLATDAVLMEEELRVDSCLKQVMDNGDRKVVNLDDLSETAGLLVREMLSSVEHDKANGNPELSYEISPYKCSDDEDEEDDKPTDKFVPSWSRRRSIMQDVFRQQRLDPDAIFPPGSFCSISEVVRPLKHQLK